MTANALRRLGLLIALAACISGLAAQVASASTIYQRSNATDADLVYSGGSAENNNVIVREITHSGQPYYEFVDTGAGITGVYSICEIVTPQRAICPRSMPDGRALDADAEVHGGADRVEMRTTSPSEIEGGPGPDDLKGGSAGDLILGNGDDLSADPDGADVIDGRGGADDMLGGDGSDTVSYASRSTAVNVSLDATANDGGFGEGDNVRSDIENISGSQGGDTLTGDGRANVLQGNGGFDQITGRGGPDTLQGGEIADSLDAGAGNDSLEGEGGNDTLLGGPDADSLNGGTDDDRLYGGGGADDMLGGDGAADQADYGGATAPLTVTVTDDQPNDGAAGEGDNVHSDIERVFGSSGNDTLEANGLGGEVWGRAGDDVLLGHNSDDLLEGGDGDDTLDGRFGADVMNGGGGIDTVDYSSHWFVDDFDEAFGVASTQNGIADDGNGWIDRSDGGTGFDNVRADIENVIGTPAPDFLRGGSISNRLIGGGDDDDLNGGGGEDDLFGESGDDLLDGGTEADAIDGGLGIDTASYRARTLPVRVTINNAANDGDVAAAEGDNVRTSVENVRGGTADDVLLGSAFANRLTGGAGDDLLNGGAHADILDGGTGSDTMTYADRTVSVAVTLDELRNDGADPNANGISTSAEEADLDLGIENVNGSAADDILSAPVADGVNNVLRGLDGDDRLRSREGTATVDTLFCGAGVGDQFAKDPADVQSSCEGALP